MKYLTPHDYEVAEANGIDRSTLYKRFYILDMPIEIATTQPKGKRRRRKYTEKIIKLAESNGISYVLFVTRVNDGWSWLQAATQQKEKKGGYRG